MTGNAKNLTVFLDGKTICSTNRLEKLESPLHIISAQISELGLTLTHRSTDDKSNEITAVQELLKTLNIKGQTVVADALNCQKETAEIIVDKGADYLLCAKDNHPNLKRALKILYRIGRFGTRWKASRKTRKTVIESRKGRRLFALKLAGWDRRKTGKIYVVSVQFIANLNRKKQVGRVALFIFQTAC